MIMESARPVVKRGHATLKVPFVDLKAQFNSLREEVEQAITDVLQSAQFVGGPWVERFESDFAAFLSCKHVVGVSSGTSALELALKAAGIKPGDEVIVPANSFFATAEAVSNVGARPVFADVDSRTFCLDVVSAETVCTPRTRAVIPVHLYGRAMDLASVEEFAARRNLAIIEDAAQAHGSSRLGKRVGSSGRLTCFSFYPGKNLGAYGEAGAIACNDAQEAQTLRLLRDHGSPSKYEHSLVGTNARIDSLQAAVLTVKLGHLEEWNTRRVRHAHEYARRLARASVVLPEIPPGDEHNFHLFVIRSHERESLRTFLESRGIGSGIHYPIPLHLTQAYQDIGYPGRGSLPVTEAIASEILSLPMYPELTPEQLELVVCAVLDFQEERNAPRGSAYVSVDGVR